MPRLTDTDRERFRHLRKLGLRLDHFFDVGASIGRWSSRMSQDFPEAQFDLFEPLIEHSEEYRTRMQTTLRRHPSFRLHKVALGPECKRTWMHLYPNNLVGSTALPLSSTPPDARPVEVDMLTVDYAIEEFRLATPRVIKMDTQGCELGILQGATKTLPKIDVLLLECWLTRAYGPSTPLLLEVAEWLRGKDFHLWDLGNAWRDEAGVLVAQDCLFVNARSNVSRLGAELRPEPKEQPVVCAKRELALQRVLSRLRLRPSSSL